MVRFSSFYKNFENTVLVRSFFFSLFLPVFVCIRLRSNHYNNNQEKDQCNRLRKYASHQTADALLKSNASSIIILQEITENNTKDTGRNRIIKNAS